MKYDDASWHYDGDFPDDLPNEAGATHIGMFVAWALLNGLNGSLWTDHFPKELEMLTRRAVAPGQFLIQFCDEKFVDEELNDDGNAFTEAYFQGHYLSEYTSLLAGDLPTCYHVSDTWQTFDKLNPVIKDRFDQWKKGELSKNTSIDADITENKPWWKRW